MTSAILLNICGYMLSVSFSPVAREAAEYYDVTADMIDMFPLVGLGVNVPGVLTGLFCINKWGIKVTTLLTVSLHTSIKGGNEIRLEFPDSWSSGARPLHLPFIRGEAGAPHQVLDHLHGSDHHGHRPSFPHHHEHQGKSSHEYHAKQLYTKVAWHPLP